MDLSGARAAAVYAGAPPRGAQCVNCLLSFAISDPHRSPALDGRRNVGADAETRRQPKPSMPTRRGLHPVDGVSTPSLCWCSRGQRPSLKTSSQTSCIPASEPRPGGPSPTPALARVKAFLILTTHPASLDTTRKTFQQTHELLGGDAITFSNQGHECQPDGIHLQRAAVLRRSSPAFPLLRLSRGCI